MTDSKFEEVTVEVTTNDGMVHDFAIESLDLNRTDRRGRGRDRNLRGLRKWS